jgi:hypothetical protein
MAWECYAAGFRILPRLTGLDGTNLVQISADRHPASYGLGVWLVQLQVTLTSLRTVDGARPLLGICGRGVIPLLRRALTYMLHLRLNGQLLAERCLISGDEADRLRRPGRMDGVR